MTRKGNSVNVWITVVDVSILAMLLRDGEFMAMVLNHWLSLHSTTRSMLLSHARE